MKQKYIIKPWTKSWHPDLMTLDDSLNKVKTTFPFLNGKQQLEFAKLFEGKPFFK